MTSRFVKLFVSLSCLTFFVGCATFRNAEVAATRLSFSPEAEAALGSQYASQVESEYTLVNDEAAAAWLQAIGNNLAAHSPETAQDFRFQITASPEVNAFAIPGGYCYVNVGLILYADNEAQLAAVIGHEINHVTRRHGLTNLQRVVGLQALTALTAASIDDDRARIAAVVAMEGGGYLAIRRFGRDDEREADNLGVKAMYDAGYDPREAAKFFQKLSELQGGRSPSFLETFLSTHPATTERVQNINQQVTNYDLWSVGLVVDTPEFQAVKERLRLMYGGDSDGG